MIQPIEYPEETQNTSTPIRSLHVLGKLSRGGIEVWLMNLLRLGDPRLHFDFAVTDVPGVFDDEVQRCGSAIHVLPRCRKTRANMAAFRTLLEKQQFDVVHCHSPEFAGDQLKIAHRMGVLGRVAQAHNTGWCRGRKSPIMQMRKLRFAVIGKRRVLMHATDVLACSHDAGRFYFGKHWGQQNTRVLHYGIPLERYDVERDPQLRQDLCRTYGIPEDAIVVGHVGSLNRPKNQGFLLRVFREIATRDDRYVLFIAGDGVLRPELERTVRQYRLETRVVMPGGCDCVPELMSHLFDTFVLPSTYEGLGLVLIEAAAGGLYCVCSDVIPKDCIDPIAERAETLPLAAPPEAWADAVESAVGRRQAPKEGCRIVGRSDFDRRKSLEKLIGIYRATLAR